MPVNRAAVVQLSLLLLAVPAQYFISNWMNNSSSSQRSQEVRNLALGLQSWTNKIFTLKTWQNWCNWVVATIQASEYYDDDDDQGESPAVEVMKYREKDGYFGGSPAPRSPRPSNIKYRVGQVIKHKKWGYRGIIIGWDEKAKAPEPWIHQMHPKDKPHWRNQPNYSILVDTRDREQAQVTYIPEENIEIIANVRIFHPAVDNYFEGFDGSQYIARPWLKVVYPHDQ
ncbi:uncharacterized protein LOC144432531 [Glandiceps talaboti]